MDKIMYIPQVTPQKNLQTTMAWKFSRTTQSEPGIWCGKLQPKWLRTFRSNWKQLFLKESAGQPYWQAGQQVLHEIIKKEYWVNNAFVYIGPISYWDDEW